MAEVGSSLGIFWSNCPVCRSRLPSTSTSQAQRISRKGEPTVKVLFFLMFEWNSIYFIALLQGCTEKPCLSVLLLAIRYLYMLTRCPLSFLFTRLKQSQLSEPPLVSLHCLHGPSLDLLQCAGVFHTGEASSTGSVSPALSRGEGSRITSLDQDPAGILHG